MDIKNPVITKQSSLEKLSGIVKRITFHSEESGWSVLKISPLYSPNKEFTVTIHQSKVFAGATVDFYGNWSHHPKYGEQFKAVKAIEQKPATANALEKYLGSGLIKGVGPATAKAIVEYFGKDTLDVFDTQIEKLDEVPNIGEKKLEMIAKAWDEHKDIKDVMIFLQSYDISTLFAVKIYKTYGKKAVEIVSVNPYRLAQDIYGIGFYSADNVARRMGVDEKSDIRIIAAIDHTLAASREEGHCFLTKDQVIVQVNELLQLQLDTEISTLLDRMENEGMLKTRILPNPLKNGQSIKCYYDHSLFYDEEYIAKKVIELAKISHQVASKRVSVWVDKYTQKFGISLSPEQNTAVRGIVGHGMSVLTGGPGCGKTTTTKVLVMLLIAMGKKVQLGAPTGRAAQRMAEVIGMQAKTIHRLLEWQPGIGKFKKSEEDPLDTDVLIIDESSMLDVHLAAALLRAVSGKTQVLLIGDADQLPAVGAGNVFKDIISSKIVPVFVLNKIFRQAEESYIIKFAHEINKGVIPLIISPLGKPNAWKEHVDCLFLDSEEATLDQLKFIRQAKQALQNTKEQQHDSAVIEDNKDLLPADSGTDEDNFTGEYEFAIPDKFRHVNMEKLLASKTQSEELIQVLKTVHPWSTLLYGMNASESIKRLYSKTIPKFLGQNAEIQILSPMTRGSLGTVQLNKMIQEEVNPAHLGKSQLQLGERVYRVADRVIQKRNNYDLQVFNGDIGKIESVDSQDMTLTVAFPQGKDTRIVTYEKDALPELDLAYAITIHKSQGSEFQAVIIPLATQHFNMLFRNLIYTGLTRGKKLVIFVGSRKALALSVKQNRSLVRQTALEYLLTQDPTEITYMQTGHIQLDM